MEQNIILTKKSSENVGTSNNRQEEEKGASGDTGVFLTPKKSDTCPTTQRESQGEGDGNGIMLIVGPEKFTSKLLKIFNTRNYSGITIKTTPELKPEDGIRWKNENLANVLFIIDKTDPNGVKLLDEHLSYLDKNFSFSMDCIDFILAQEPTDATPVSPAINLSGEILKFLNKFNRPMVNLKFDDGWENDPELYEQMCMFLNRFQINQKEECNPPVVDNF